MQTKPCLLIFKGIDHESTAGTGGLVACVQTKSEDHYGDISLKEDVVVRLFSRLSQDVKSVSLGETFFEVSYPDASGRPCVSETWRFVRGEHDDIVRHVVLQDGRALLCTDISPTRYGEGGKPILDLTT